MALYSGRDCLNAYYSAVEWDESLGAYSVTGDPCSVHISQLLAGSDLQTARWVGVGLLGAFLVLGLHKLWSICSQHFAQLRLSGIKSSSQSFVHSAPFLAHSFLTAFNLALLLTLADPSGAYELYPDLFRDFLVFVMAYCIFSLLVILVYKMWYSILLEFDGELLNAASQPIYLRIMFLQLLVASILVAYPTNNLIARGLQSLILVAEAVFFAVICLWFGCKLHSRLLSHQNQMNVDYSRALLKIRILLLGTLIAVIVSVFVNTRSAISSFGRSASAIDAFSATRLKSNFWFGMAFLYFISTLINVVAVLVFRSTGKTSSKTATRRSSKRESSRRKPAETSPVNAESGSILNRSVILAVPDSLPVSPTSVQIDFNPTVVESPK